MVYIYLQEQPAKEQAAIVQNQSQPPSQSIPPSHVPYQEEETPVIEETPQQYDQSTDPTSGEIMDICDKGMGPAWNNSMVVLIGAGRSGKTATANSMAGQAFTPTRSTVGMEQHDLTLNITTSTVSATNSHTAATVWMSDGANDTNSLEYAIAQQLLLHKTEGNSSGQTETDSMNELMKTLQQEKDDVSVVQVNLQDNKIENVNLEARSTIDTTKALGLSTPAITTAAAGTKVNTHEGVTISDHANKKVANTKNDNDTILTPAASSNSHTTNNSSTATSTAIRKEPSRMKVNEELVLTLFESMTMKRAKTDGSHGDCVDNHDELKIALFDFGGQWVFSVILHLFIRRNGCYVLCFNMEWLQENHPDYDQCLNNLRYWLNSISIHTWSERQRDTAKIVLCGTHKDTISDPASHDRISQLLYDTFHKDNTIWPNVVKNKDGIGTKGTTTHCFFPIDNKLGHRDVILQHLMKEVQEVMIASPYTKRNVPLSWHRFVDAIAENVKKGNSKILFDTAKQMALDCQVPENEVPLLLHFLHEMGHLLWLDSPKLRDVVILDVVQYFVQHVTKFICKLKPSENNYKNDPTHHDLEEHKQCQKHLPDEWESLRDNGILYTTLLQHLWPHCHLQTPKDLPEQGQLLRLMVKFGLLYPLPDDIVTYSGSSPTRQEAPTYPSQQPQDFTTSKRFLVPALLPSPPADLKDDTLWCSSSSSSSSRLGYQTFYMFFTKKRRMTESPTVLLVDMATDGFLPDGLFQRLLCKVLRWCIQTSRKNIHDFGLFDTLVVLFFGSQRFRLQELPSLSAIRVDIEGANPRIVMDRLLEQAKEVISECMGALLVMVLVPFIDKNGPTSANQNILAGRENGEDRLLLSVSEIVRTAKDRGVLTNRAGGRQLLSSSEILQLYAAWIPQILLRDGVVSSYDVFESYRWGPVDSAIVCAIFDLLTAYNVSKYHRRIIAFKDTECLSVGKTFDKEFSLALCKSLIVCPVVSYDALLKMIQHDCTAVDNVLLEWILCWVFMEAGSDGSSNEAKKVRVRRVVPLLKGIYEHDKDGVTTRQKPLFACSLPDEICAKINCPKGVTALDALPAEICPEATLDKALHLLQDIGELNTCIGLVTKMRADGVSVKTIVQNMLNFLAFLSWEHDDGVVENVAPRFVEFLMPHLCDVVDSDDRLQEETERGVGNAQVPAQTVGSNGGSNHSGGNNNDSSSSAGGKDFEGAWEVLQNSANAIDAEALTSHMHQIGLLQVVSTGQAYAMNSMHEPIDMSISFSSSPSGTQITYLYPTNHPFSLLTYHCT